jgi:uncharacterized YigZ family protein
MVLSVRPRYLTADSRCEQTIKKSRFISRLYPVDNAEQAKTILLEIRRQDHAARHHATAIILGADLGYQRSSDDGEPPGTAGLPMLQTLRRAGVTDILAVVTRYFGGIQLGKAGLRSAYAGGVEAALDRASFSIKQWLSGFAIAVHPVDTGKAEHLLRVFAETNHGDATGWTGQGDDLEFELWLPTNTADQLAGWLSSSSLRWSSRPLGQRLVTMAA